MKITTLKLALAFALALAACSAEQDEPKSKLSKQQLDSAIAASKLPGAGVVGKALEQSDSARARAEREEEAGKDEE